MPTAPRKKEIYSRKRVKRRYFVLEFIFPTDNHRSQFEEFFDQQQQMLRQPQQHSAKPAGRQQTAEELFEGVMSNYFIKLFRKFWGEMGEALLFTQMYYVPRGALHNVNITYFNPKTRLCIVRVEKNLADMFRMMMPMINNFKPMNVQRDAAGGASGTPKIPCSVRIIHVSGTIRSVKEPATQYQLRVLHELQYQEHEIEQMLLPLALLNE